MSFDIVNFLLGPAQILAQGMVGLIVGLGTNALQIWLMYQIVVLVPPRARNLVDAIDMESSQTQYYGGTRYRIYQAMFQIFLPVILIGVCYTAFCVFTGIVMDLFPASGLF
jgi:hypothetical protein